MANITEFADHQRGPDSRSFLVHTCRDAAFNDQAALVSLAGLIDDSCDEDDQVDRLSALSAGLAIAITSAASWVSLVGIVVVLV